MGERVDKSGAANGNGKRHFCASNSFPLRKVRPNHHHPGPKTRDISSPTHPHLSLLLGGDGRGLSRHDKCFVYPHKPRCSMYGLFTYIWVVLVVNVGKYTTQSIWVPNMEKKITWILEAKPQNLPPVWLGFDFYICVHGALHQMSIIPIQFFSWWSLDPLIETHLLVKIRSSPPQKKLGKYALFRFDFNTY